MTFYGAPLGPKRLELLHELAPQAKVVALLSNPENVTIEAQRLAIMAAARSLGLSLRVVRASSEGDLEAAFATMAQEHVGGLLIGTDALFNNQIDQLVALASRHAVPAVYFLRDFVVAGGLASYGASVISAYRQGAAYVARILKGTKPSELPVLEPTKFELVINLKTARALALQVPPNLLSIADEVIE